MGVAQVVKPETLQPGAGGRAAEGLGDRVRVHRGAAGAAEDIVKGTMGRPASIDSSRSASRRATDSGISATTLARLDLGGRTSSAPALILIRARRTESLDAVQSMSPHRSPRTSDLLSPVWAARRTKERRTGAEVDERKRCSSSQSRDMNSFRTMDGGLTPPAGLLASTPDRTASPRAIDRTRCTCPTVFGERPRTRTPPRRGGGPRRPAPGPE